jgi:ribosomal protein S18 acetylase RimI-like enzyme
VLAKACEDQDVVGGDEVRIRPAIVADGEWLKALHKVAYASLSEQLQDPRAEAWQDGFFAGRIAHPIDLFIVERDGKDVGAVYLENRPDAVFVESLEVLPEHQGRGVGTSTLKWVLRHAARLGSYVGLQVHKQNPHAQSLYRGIGFTVIGETATHYRMCSAEEPAG